LNALDALDVGAPHHAKSMILAIVAASGETKNRIMPKDLVCSNFGLELISSSPHKSNSNNLQKKKKHNQNTSTMKFSNIVATAFFAVQAFPTVVMSEKPTYLRAKDTINDSVNNMTPPASMSRNLLVGTITFSQIVNAFQPVLAVATEAALAAGADPVRFNTQILLLYIHDNQP
jgi:hypothetical protein